MLRDEAFQQPVPFLCGEKLPNGNIFNDYISGDQFILLHTQNFPLLTYELIGL